MISDYIWCEKIEKRRDIQICQKLNCQWLVKKDGKPDCTFVSAKEKRIKKFHRKERKKNRGE
jgi:hypothetical protein